MADNTITIRLDVEAVENDTDKIHDKLVKNCEEISANLEKAIGKMEDTMAGMLEGGIPEDAVKAWGEVFSDTLRNELTASLGEAVNDAYGVEKQKAEQEKRKNEEEERKATEKNVQAKKKATTHTNKFAGAVRNLGNRAKTSAKNMLRMAIGAVGLVAIFNKLKRGFNEGLTNLQLFSNEVKNSINSMKSAFLNMKNSIASALTPVINAIAPVVTNMLNKVTEAFNYLSMFIAKLAGQKTYIKALTSYQKDFTDSLNGMSKALGAYDKLNVIDKDQNDASKMFEEVAVDGDSYIDNLISSIQNGDWDKVGEAIGQLVVNALTSVGEFLTSAKWVEIFQGIGESFAGFINELTSNNGEMFVSLGKGITNFINGIFTMINTLLTNTDWKALGVALINTLVTMVQSLDWKSIAESAVNFGMAIIDLFKGFLSTNDKEGKSQVQVLLNGIIESIMVTITTLIDNLPSMVSGLIDVIFGLIDAILGALCDFIQDGKNAGRIVRSFIILVSTVVSAIAKIIAKLFSTLFKFIGSLFNGEAWNGWDKEFTEGFGAESLTETLKKQWEEVGNAWNEAGKQLEKINIFIGIGTAIVETWQDVKEKVKKWWAETKEKVGTFLFNIGSKISETWKEIKSKITTWWNETKEKIGTFLFNIGAKISETWKDIKSKIATWWSNVKEKIGTFLFNIGAKIATTIENMKTKIATWWSNVKEAVGDIVLGIGTKLKKKATEFKDTIIKWWNKVIEGVGDLIMNIKGAIGTTWSKMVSAISVWWGSVTRNAGEFIIGIAMGIKTTVDDIKKQAKTIINGIIDVLNQGLDKIYPALFGGTWYNSLSKEQKEAMHIPHLASGAVIPANHEFLAVLGDQKSGTNIEAPLDTIKQALAEVMASNNAGSGTVNLYISETDSEPVMRWFRNEQSKYNKRYGLT